MTENEIKAIYKQQHDALTESYYAGTSGLTKEQFDTQHGQIWIDMETKLIAEGYMQSKKPYQPPRDIAKELDDLKTLLKSKGIL